MKIIIVGQGISGTNIAFEAIRRKHQIKVIDSPTPFSPSKIAAGMFNPVTFRVPTLSHNASTYFPLLKDFYSRLQGLTATPFYYPLPYTRLFSSAEEQNNWIHRCSREDFIQYASSKVKPYSEPLIAPYQGSEVYEAGYIETRTMLDAFRIYLKNHGALIEEPFQHDALEIQEDKISYTASGQQLTGDYIIFAEGPKVQSNPYFNGLPFKPVKGEVLDLRIRRFQQSRIFSKGMFLVPRGNSMYYAGATYANNENNNTPTEQGKEKIISKIKKLVNLPHEIVSHRAGVRPATKDRKPMIGRHPDFPRLLLFNGMGSKAVSTTPYLSSHLLNHIEYGTPVDSEVDLKRYWKK